MAIIKLTKDLFENVSIVARPHRTYVSSSAGSTGELTLSARPSERISEVTHLPAGNGLLLAISEIETAGNGSLTGPGGTNATYPSLYQATFQGNSVIFAGTNTGIQAGLHPFLQKGPNFFRAISLYKQRRIADTKKLYITASFFDPDIHVGKGSTLLISGPPQNVSYNKLTTNPSFIVNERDTQLLEYFEGSSENLGAKSFLAPRSVSPDETFSLGVDANRKYRMFKWDYRKNDSIRNSNGLRYIKDVLMDQYRTRYDHCEYSFSNFQCLNFFTSSYTNSDAVLVYPNSSPTPGGQHLLPVSQQLTASGGPYTVEKEMTVDFWINPKYDNVRPEWPFHAGTILHHSSSYAISLTSGSFKDSKNLVDSYRLLVQLGPTASQKRPRSLSPVAISQGEFWSKDGLLRKNHWHRVTILIKTPTDCEIIIDDNRERITNAPLRMNNMYADQTEGHHGQIGLFVGNYYFGPYHQVRNFFSADISDREGFFEADTITNHRYENKVLSTDASADINGEVTLDLPLCAEIHDLKLYKKKLSDSEIEELKSEGVNFEEGNSKKLAFYLPVFFNPRCRNRKTLTSPFAEAFDRPYTPTNSNFSLGVGGKLVNLENYVKDYAQGNLPRLYHLTESLNTYAAPDIDVVDGAFNRIQTNKFVYEFKGTSAASSEAAIASKGRTARNLMILPCDNGLATVNYDCLIRDLSGNPIVRSNGVDDFTDSTNNNPLSTLDIISSDNPKIFRVKKNSLFANIEKRMHNELDNFAIDKVSMRNYLTKSFRRGDELVETKGDRMELYPVSYILENTDSRDVTLFDIPSIFYGERIHPESLQISSDSVTGSQGRIKVTVKDNGKGSLYRADALTTHAKNVSVGNVFYDEGLVLYKSPHPLYFGKGGFSFDFKGEHTVHSLQINAPCPKDLIFSSSNPTYKFLSASAEPQDEDNDFVYITDINIHDDNLNVIMKATLAQPVVKRSTDSFMFKLRQDF